eukprot:UN16798
MCRNRHGLRVHCQNYVLGFCPDGPKCKFGHPKYELPMNTTDPVTKMSVSANYLRRIRANLKEQLQSTGLLKDQNQINQQQQQMPNHRNQRRF